MVSSSEENLFAWESYIDAIAPKDGWRCLGCPGSRYSRPSVSVSSERRSEKTLDFPQTREWSIPAPWLSLRYAWAEVPALVAYLVATPGARDALQDGERLLRLVEAFKAGPMFERPLPEHHAMGDKLDIDNAIEKVFAATGLRLFGGRPVRGEPLPPSADLVPAVRKTLAPRVQERAEDDEIERRIARFLAVRPWPFDCLLNGEPDRA